MLVRIHQIKGLGLLHDANGASYGLKKASFIYADNGRGKSTLASLFRSCSTNNPNLITNRITIDGTNEQDIKLEFSQGQESIFQNGNWSQQRPELLVFDADFVEQNVYSGGQVSPNQRRNLLQFALGASAVTAQREYEQANESAQQATSNVRDKESQLEGFHSGISLLLFQQIPAVPDADEQIVRLNQRIVEAENIGVIQAKNLPNLLTLPSFNIDPFFRIITTSLTNIDQTAEARVKEHLENHSIPNLGRWVNQGSNFGEEENCPFCDQSLEGVELITAYRSYFNHDYNQLKSDVTSLEQFISSNCSDVIIERLKTNVEKAKLILTGWQDHLELSDITFQEDVARQAITDLKQLLETLKERKESNLLEPQGSEPEKQEILSKWKEFTDTVTVCNVEITASIATINNYKDTLATVDTSSLSQEIINLQRAKQRHEPAVVQLLTELTTVKDIKTTALTKKESKKTQLNQTMKTTLATYKNHINELLRTFGAQFKIPNINFNYQGGLSSDYALQMRGGNIALNGGTHDFRTSLSEGDKRTLAFAFFIASIEADPNLANKIVIIDDPMCSLDLNRKQQTRTVLKRIHDNCEQLIILAHDAQFLRQLKKDILRPRTVNLTNTKCIKLKSIEDDYSDFNAIDLDIECETSYFKSHRILDEFLAGRLSNNMEAAKSIRPMLEGYLHRRFPGKIDGGLLFGQVIDLINNAQNQDPLVYAQNITGELNEINLYAGQFHHDTNPAVEQVIIVDSELRTFVTRALKVVHKGINIV